MLVVTPAEAGDIDRDPEGLSRGGDLCLRDRCGGGRQHTARQQRKETLHERFRADVAGHEENLKKSTEVTPEMQRINRPWP
jgi:hypothetical protein